MIGTKFLLDTNFVIGLLKENLQIASRLQDQEIVIGECAYSFITDGRNFGIGELHIQQPTLLPMTGNGNS